MKTPILYLASVVFSLAGEIPQAPERPFIYVTGSAKVEVAADAVRIHFAVSANSKEQKIAYDSVTEKSLAIVSALKSLPIQDSDIDALGITIVPEYDYKDGQKPLIGYSVERDFKVLLRDIGKLATVIDSLRKIGIEHLQPPIGVSFKEHEASSSAFKKAFDDARSRAELLAASSGLKITSVGAVSEAPPPDINQQFFDSSSQEDLIKLTSFGVAKLDAQMEQASLMVPPIILVSSVHVVFLAKPI